jgi:hypothetical protein
MSRIIVSSNTSGTGTVTLQAPSINSDSTFILPSGNGTLSSLSLGTQVATTSGTTVTVATNIPSTVRRVTVMLYGVSTNGTSPIIIQFGTGTTPTYVTSGYTSSSDNYQTAAGPIAVSTIGFIIGSVNAAAAAWYVPYVFVNMGSNMWVGGFSGTDRTVGLSLGGGAVTLSDPLTAIRLNTVSGTGVFDAGTVNILYE